MFFEGLYKSSLLFQGWQRNGELFERRLPQAHSSGYSNEIPLSGFPY